MMLQNTRSRPTLFRSVKDAIPFVIVSMLLFGVLLGALAIGLHNKRVKDTIVPVRSITSVEISPNISEQIVRDKECLEKVSASEFKWGV